MSFGMAQSIPPSNSVVVAGIIVYQSTHLGGITNDSEAPFQVILNALMTDSFGNTAPTSIVSDVVEPGQTKSLSTTCKIPVSTYASGTQVTFEVTTNIQGGGVSTSDRASNTLIVP